jgi:hypothetical protein
MPGLREHCRISIERTGKDFSDLHKWMDEPKEKFGIGHRGERHDSSWMNYVSSRWGTDGVKEFLYHIEIDNRDTRKKIEQIEKEDNILKEKIGGAETIKPMFTCPKCRCHSFFEIQGQKVCANCYGK